MGSGGAAGTSGACLFLLLLSINQINNPMITIPTIPPTIGPAIHLRSRSSDCELPRPEFRSDTSVSVLEVEAVLAGFWVLVDETSPVVVFLTDACVLVFDIDEVEVASLPVVAM
jgi:hypothetical protein